MAVGRISGPLLKENLIRNGINLAFENDLLYLEVNNQRIGIKTSSPTHELQVNGTTRTTDLIVDNCAYIADVTVCGNTISTNEPYLNLATLDTVVSLNKLRVDSIDIEGNAISTNESNADLELRPNGTGTVNVHSNMNVDGSIHATGDIQADGNITIGNADTDYVSFNAEIASDIIPDLDDTYTLGSASKRWNDVWTTNLYASSVSSTDLEVDGIDLTLRHGNIYYVAENGDDSATGTHIQDPVKTIKRAIQLADPGDTIHIYPGSYTEEFPLALKAGQTITGQSLRSVIIRPTTETRYNDAFLLQGETTVENLTVTGFYSGGNFFEVLSMPAANQFTVNVGTSPFAHTYVSGGTIDSDDSTIANVSNATYNHTTGILTVTTDVAHDTYLGAKLFLSGLTFSCNSGTRVFPDNGYAFRFATDFEVTTRSPYIRNVTVITEGTSTSALDPRGFDTGDAGKGAYVDGAYATASSNEASMLFHSATFITPGVDCITATNGVRIEWLNSFTYFANRSIYAYDSNDGLAGDGKTRIRLSGISGSFNPLDTITFTSTDSSTVIGPLSIDSVDGDVIIVDGKQDDLLAFDWTPASIVGTSGSATAIENVDIKDFGAEIRLIASASVYGNYGLVGDGPGVLMYAIGHNMAYIGTGKEYQNDPEAVLQDNEVIELNNAKVRYNTVDHEGDFRVGDLFHIDQQTGNVDFNAANFTITTTGGLTITDGVDTTYISATTIDTGNLSIHDNTIESIAGDVNIDAASNQINLNSNVNIDGNLDVTGNVTIGGNITIGDEASDTIQFVAGIDSDIIPAVTSIYSLGESSLRWSNLWVNQTNIDDIEIQNNYIQTTASNADLELRANGTGEIYVPNNDVQIDNNLRVDGTTTLANTNITGTVTLVGDINQTGNYTISNDVSIGENLTVGASAQFEEILIDDNYITTTSSNADLELRAAGTGNIYIPDNDVNITNDLTVNGDIDANNLTTAGLITADSFTTGDILIDDNVIQTTLSNSDLELIANGTGEIYVPSNDVVFGQDLTVSGNTDLQDTTITGSVNHIGDTVQVGNFDIAGYISNGNIEIAGNVIETTNSNSDLELRANGTGEIYIPTNNVQIDNNLTVSGDTDLQDTTVTGTILHTGNTTHTGNYIITGSFSNGDLNINNNVIQTLVTNSDLELRAAGTGIVTAPYNDVVFGQNLTVSGDTDLQDTAITGTITHVGNTTQTGNVNLTGNYDIDGKVTITSTAQFEDIKIETNFVTTTRSNSDLELRASGTGEVIIPNNDVVITNDLQVDGTITVGDITSLGTITANRFTTGDILIDDNFITTTTSNSNLELRANGTGDILVPSNDVTFEQDLTVNGSTYLKDTNIIGDITHTGNVTQTGNINLTGNFTISGELNVTSEMQFEDIEIAGNVITTTLSNSDLELRANGTGEILIPNNNVTISNNLTIDGTLTVGDVISTGLIQANRFTTGDILIDDNFITTTNSNSDLELRAAGTGSIIIDTFDINDATITTTGDFNITPGTGLLNVNGTGAIKLPVGDTSQRPTAVAGQIRYNSDYSRFEGYNGTNWVNLKGVEDLDGNTRVTAELTEGANDNVIRFYNDGNLTVDINSTRLNAPKVTVDNITIDGNVISTTTTNTDLVLGANGTGSVVIDNFAISDNTITNTVSNSVTVFENTDNGYVKFDGTYGMVIPTGASAGRPPLAYTETGMMRFNTDDVRVEIWDGSNWVSVAGAAVGISRGDAENIAFETVIMFG